MKAEYRMVTKREMKFIYFSLGVMWLLIATTVPTFIRFMMTMYEGADIKDAIMYAFGLL